MRTYHFPIEFASQLVRASLESIDVSGDNEIVARAGGTYMKLRGSW